MKNMLEILLVLQAIILIPALITGLIVSLFQAATQINEMTLSFIPKLFITVIVFMLSGPWLLSYFVSYSRRLIENIPFVIG